MVSDQTIARLRWHAGFDGQPSPRGSSIFSSTTSQIRSAADFESALSDCLETLSVLNRAQNGDVPSSTIGAVEDHLPRGLVYAMTEIVRMIRDRERRTSDKSEAITLARAAWQIDTAWSAVLAGDIDDLLDHVKGEESWLLGVAAKSDGKLMPDAESVAIRVPENSFGLLREVLERRAPQLLLALRDGFAVVIQEGQRREIQELVGDEFAETGVRENHEPNERGLALEKLIDVFSPYK
jgi:hypothetical protein